MPKAHDSKRPVTNPQAPEREDIEAELPRAPARSPAPSESPEPSAEPTAIGGTRGPRPTVEPEVE
jgi:hypothetical protein